MLRKIRMYTGILFLGLLTLLFLDFTGTIHHFFSWIAKVQLLPAILAVNIIALAVVLLLTLTVGRLYCSVICPLGILQDGISWLSGRFKRHRHSYSKEIVWLRYPILGLTTLAIILGFSSIALLLDPYSMYGRIANTLLSPIYQLVNNGLAYLAERENSYAFYSVEVCSKGVVVIATATASLIIISILAWRNGRTYCNTICPVGTLLGLISRHSVYQIRIDSSKCNGCKACEQSCKSSCIDSSNHHVDMSRCVSCFSCIGKCKKSAVTFAPKDRRIATIEEEEQLTSDGSSRRKFISILALFAVSTAVKSQKKKVDGGLALIKGKQIPHRNATILPAGSHSHRSFYQHCTGCQLCVSSCPNQVLRPSSNLATIMQPEMSYERGYCRPECTACSEVCPTGAIERVSREEKSSIQIGHAAWIMKNCVVVSDHVSCGNCARHCPSAAIQMIPLSANNADSLKIPAINTERCIGCGACEYVCPSRPFSAIYVEGHIMHRTI